MYNVNSAGGEPIHFSGERMAWKRTYPCKGDRGNMLGLRSGHVGRIGGDDYIRASPKWTGMRDEQPEEREVEVRYENPKLLKLKAAIAARRK